MPGLEDSGRRNGEERGMNASFEYFLVVAEEKNISRAAQKLFLSPQNLNNHIHRLEKTYGTLFIRKPQFQLTPVGQMLYQTIQQIAVLEKNLDARVSECRTDGYGYLRVGIHSTRARILLPYVVPVFERKYPGIFLDFIYRNQGELEQMLRNGELDVVVAVDSDSDAAFDCHRLFQEPIFFVATRRMMTEKGVDPAEGKIRVSQMSGFRYMLSPPKSRIRKKIDLFCKENGLSLYETIRISDYELQLLLASEAVGACFCPRMLLRRMKELNRLASEENRLCALPIENFSYGFDLCMLTHRLAKPTTALKNFIAVFQQELSDSWPDQ